MALFRSESLLEGTTSLLNSEKYSDLTITTQTRSFKVHKAIICTQSKVLAAMSDAGFKETSTAILVLEHDHPVAIECMVAFLYTGDYDDEAAADTDTSLMLHALVYSLADKYDIQGLKRLAQVNFDDEADDGMCKDFAAIVATVFETTYSNDKGLRGVVCRICADNIDEVLASETWSDLFANNGEICYAIIKLAYQRFVQEVGKARHKVEAREKELEKVKKCNERLHRRFDLALTDIDKLLDKSHEGRREEPCDVCRNNLLKWLLYDLILFNGDLREDVASKIQGLPNEG